MLVIYIKVNIEMIYQSPESPSISLSAPSTNLPWSDDMLVSVAKNPLPGHDLGAIKDYDTWTDFQNNYSVAEVVWGCILVIGITIVNSAVLWVVAKSRELWKPRHLWMACLCITDLGVGAHKALELLLLVWPQRELCVVQRTTLGVPYVVNMLLLTILSLDRFVAVVYPFFYSASVSNKHVLMGFLIVLLTGAALAGASVGIGMQDELCRPQSLQLVYLTVVLTVCSILTLLFNSSVLRIAKKQLHAIYTEPLMNAHRRVSLFCTNCGHRNATFVNTLSPPPPTMDHINETQLSPVQRENTNHSIGHLLSLPITLPLKLPQPEPVMYEFGQEESEKQVHFKRSNSNFEAIPLTHATDLECGGTGNEEFSDFPPLYRTVSLPAIPENLTLIIPSDPHSPVATISGNDSPIDMIENSMKLNSSMSNLQPPQLPSPSGPATLPRSRSFTCAKKVSTPGPPKQLLRNLQFGRSHVFHVGRLFPSIRFARTVLLIMIPMWIFILPIVTIIPLHRGCSEDSNSDLNCNLVNKLWAYLLVHIRSVLPLQAIIDTLIYAFGSKEFRQAFKKISDWNRQRKRLRAYKRNIVNGSTKS